MKLDIFWITTVDGHNYGHFFGFGGFGGVKNNYP